MIIGIVGAEAAKFTPRGEQAARKAIRHLFATYKPDKVVSGSCHLGGIDGWAIEEARKYNIPTLEFPPKRRRWQWYRLRNQQIAQASDLVVCITVTQVSPNFQGQVYDFCYHCRTDDHVKSGGCWTVKYARSIGKKGKIIILTENTPCPKTSNP